MKRLNAIYYHEPYWIVDSCVVHNTDHNIIHICIGYNPYYWTVKIVDHGDLGIDPLLMNHEPSPPWGKHPADPATGCRSSHDRLSQSQHIATICEVPSITVGHVENTAWKQPMLACRTPFYQRIIMPSKFHAGPIKEPFRTEFIMVQYLVDNPNPLVITFWAWLLVNS